MPLERLKLLNTRECLWIYILKLLTEKPMHAYALRSQIHERFGFRPGTVTAYKVLYLLNRGGLVEKKSSGRQKVYTITSRGRKTLGEAAAFYRERARLLEI
jgi:DNA-binding PadR family transcriptional regulator